MNVHIEEELALPSGAQMCKLGPSMFTHQGCPDLDGPLSVSVNMLS